MSSGRARWSARGGLAVLLLSLLVASESPAQSIAIDSMPPYGSLGYLSGTVNGVDPSSHHVAVYIQIEGSGWWTKPTFANPTVPISPSGAFSADVGTGGAGSLDSRATILCAALLPEAVDPPSAAGAGRIPATLAPLALDCRERYARTVEFAGRTWAVKESPLPVGPGPNVFSDRSEDVFVDAQGRLHLRVAWHDGQWWSTEVILLAHLGHGTYALQTESELDDLDVNVTFGFFTWDSYGDEETVPDAGNREIDFEDSRWGIRSDPTNAQMVVQPFDRPGNLHRYTIPDLALDPALTRLFTWLPGSIHFVALRGHHPPTGFETMDVIDEHIHPHDPPARYVPTAGRESPRLNLWLNGLEPGGTGSPQPADGSPVEVVVTDFSYLPEPSSGLLRALAAATIGLLAGRRRTLQGQGAGGRYSSSSTAASSGVPS